MKRIRHFLIFALFLSFANVEGIHAQGFFKQLLEAAGSILEDSSNGSSSNGSSSSSSSTSGSSSTSSKSASGYIPNVTFKVTECEHWGDGAVLRFVLTNTSSEDMTIAIKDSSDGEQYAAYDENNNRRSYVPFVGGKQLTGLGEGYSAKLPAGVPVKCYFYIANVPTSTTKISKLYFAGHVGKDLAHNSGKDYSYQIGEQTITYAKNTNRDNIFLSIPTVNYAYTKAYRSGQDIVLEGTLTNKRASDMNMKRLYSDDKSSIYDSEGNAYKAYMMVGANELSAFSDTKLPADIPVKCKVVVKNVPTTIHEFSIVKTYFEIGDAYYLQFRNLKF